MFLSAIRVQHRHAPRAGPDKILENLYSLPADIDSAS